MGILAILPPLLLTPWLGLALCNQDLARFVSAPGIRIIVRHAPLPARSRAFSGLQHAVLRSIWHSSLTSPPSFDPHRPNFCQSPFFCWLGAFL